MASEDGHPRARLGEGRSHGTPKLPTAARDDGGAATHVEERL
jgi:hypothetical protein